MEPLIYSFYFRSTTKFLRGEPRWIRQQHLGFHNGQFIVDSLHLLLHLKFPRSKTYGETSAYPRGQPGQLRFSQQGIHFLRCRNTSKHIFVSTSENYSFSRKQHGSATIFLPQWLRWRLNCQVFSLLVEILKFAALICSFLGCKSLGFRIIFEWQKKGRNWRKNIAKPCWLVVLSILKHMSSSVGMIIPNIWKVIKFMFQTTNQHGIQVHSAFSRTVLLKIRLSTISRLQETVKGCQYVLVLISGINQHWLVVDLPLWKIWVRQLGLLFIPNIWKNKIHVPNHQPEHDESTMSQLWMRIWAWNSPHLHIDILTYHRHPTRPPRTPHGICSLWVLGSKLGFHHDIILDTKHLVFPESWGYPKLAGWFISWKIHL